MIYHFLVNCILYSADVSPSVRPFELLNFFFYPKRPFYIAFIRFYLYTLFLYYLSLLLTGRISVFLYICAIYGQVAIVCFFKFVAVFLFYGPFFLVVCYRRMYVCIAIREAAKKIFLVALKRIPTKKFSKKFMD